MTMSCQDIWNSTFFWGDILGAPFERGVSISWRYECMWWSGSYAQKTNIPYFVIAMWWRALKRDSEVPKEWKDKDKMKIVKFLKFETAQIFENLRTHVGSVIWIWNLRGVWVIGKGTLGFLLVHKKQLSTPRQIVWGKILIPRRQNNFIFGIL